MFHITRRHAVRSAGALVAAAAVAAFASGASAQDKIKIGYAISKTGPYAGGAGITTLPNYELWVKDVNAAGGIKLGDKRLTIEVVEYDDRSNSEEAVKAIERLANQDKVDFILAPWGTGLNLAVGPTLNRLGYPHLAEQLVVAAGATAHLLRLKADAWHRYLPPSAEPTYSELASASSVLAFQVEQDLALTVARSIAAIAAELANPARSGASSIISSELTLMVIRFRRLFATEAALDAEGCAAEILTRFRRLVEERYHQQLRVGDYARLLGVTPDRLHALCSRAMQRSPSALIQQRIVQEGITRLETGTATVKQIAFALGFKDTAYFNRYFRKHTGKPPGAWRRSAAQQGLRKRTDKTALNFADWP